MSTLYVNNIEEKDSGSKITLGNTLKVDSIEPKTAGGIITFNPNNPAFFAKVNSDQPNIAVNQWVDVAFSNIIANQGSHFGGTVLTAPVTGYYHFSTYLRLDNVDTAATYYLLGWLIGGTAIQADIIDPNFSSDLSYMGRNSSLTYYMTASQTAQVRIYQANGTSQTDVITDSWFSGHLIG